VGSKPWRAGWTVITRRPCGIGCCGERNNGLLILPADAIAIIRKFRSSGKNSAEVSKKTGKRQRGNDLKRYTWERAERQLKNSYRRRSCRGAGARAERNLHLIALQRKLTWLGFVHGSAKKQQSSLTLTSLPLGVHKCHSKGSFKGLQKCSKIPVSVYCTGLRGRVWNRQSLANSEPDHHTGIDEQNNLRFADSRALWLGGEILFRRLRRYLRKEEDTKMRICRLSRFGGKPPPTPKKMHTDLKSTVRKSVLTCQQRLQHTKETAITLLG